jgi:hypothetical protein
VIEDEVDLEVLPVSKSQRNVNHRWVLVILVVSLISNISAFQNTFFPLKSKTTSSIKSQLEVEDVIVDA